MNLLEQQKNPALDFDASKSVANTFDMGKAAGPMQGASSISVDDKMLASKQLEGILSKDNALFQKARARAGAAAARRGLLNSSIGVEAGESAMIDAALPLAQSDASTNFNAAQFNASAANDFARDANNFGRQGAMARFGHLAGMESDGRRMAFDSFERGADRTHQSGENLLERQFRSGESALDRSHQAGMQDREFGFRTNERIGGQEFQAGQSALDRSFQSSERLADRNFQAGQSQIDRDFRGEQAGLDRTQQRDLQTQDQQFRAGEADLGRQFEAAQRGLDRTQQMALQQNQQEWAAAQQKLANQFQMDFERFKLPMNMMAGFQDRMQGFVTQIMSDPNMDAVAKDQAIKNYYAYSQQTMGWMANYFGQSMPNVATGGTISPTPAQAPSTAPPVIPPDIGVPPTLPLRPGVSDIGPVDPADLAPIGREPGPNVGIPPGIDPDHPMWRRIALER